MRKLKWKLRSLKNRIRDFYWTKTGKFKPIPGVSALIACDCDKCKLYRPHDKGKSCPLATIELQDGKCISGQAK